MTAELAKNPTGLGLTQCLDPNHCVADQTFTWTSLGLEQHPAGILAELCVEGGVEVFKC